MRDVMEKMQFLPMNGSVKVYLIDEVHSTTRDGQNAVLKALEDTPQHVYFLLCTTDPEKLLPTIRNRCTTFTVTKLQPNKLQHLLQ